MYISTRLVCAQICVAVALGSQDGLEGIVQAMAVPARDIVNGFVEGVNQAVASAVGGAGQAVAGVASDVAGAAAGAVSGVVSGVASGVAGVASDVAGAASDAAGAISSVQDNQISAELNSYHSAATPLVADAGRWQSVAIAVLSTAFVCARLS